MKWDNAQMDRIASGPAMRQHMEQVAEGVAQEMRTTAPVGDTSEYARSFVVTSKLQERAVALIINTDPKSMIVEARTGHMARTLKKAGRRGRR